MGDLILSLFKNPLNQACDGTEIDLSSGDLTLDVAGNISLDADDGGHVRFKDGGTQYASIYKSGSGAIIDTPSGGDITLDSANDIILDADGAEIKLSDGGTQFANLYTSSSDFYIQSSVQDKDIIFQGDDGGTSFTALTLDMSEAGAATFNDNVTAFSDERLKSNIETLKGGLEKVEQLRGVTYTRDERDNIGVIAQEVEKVLPEIVLTADDEMGTKSVDYSRITAVLIEAVKELSAKVKYLEENHHTH